MPSWITRNMLQHGVKAIVATFCLLGMVLTFAGQTDPVKSTTPGPDKASDFANGVQPFLKKFCLDCHSGTEPDAGFKLDAFKTELEAGREELRWRQVLEKLENGEMPPPDHDAKPSDAEKKVILDWIDRTFIHVDCSQSRDPGRVTTRRLNRTEYNNTIRDLVGVDFKPAADFPTDDVGYGFDNIGDVLTLSPLLMEKYMDAAEKIAAKALSSVDLTRPHVVRLEGPELKGTGAAQLNEYGYHMLASKGTVTGEFNFPFDGEYILRTRVTADQAGPEPVKMGLMLQDKQLQVIEVPRHKEAGFFELRTVVKKGKRPVGVEFLNDYYDPNGPDPEHRDRNLGVHLIEVEGPFGVDRSMSRELLPETHRRIIFTVPTAEKPADECAKEILTKFAGRAYRRPVTDEELAPLLKLVQLGMESGESFDGAIQLAVQAVLVSPNFLFRIERDNDPNNPQATHTVADYELATRLSYFLWSTMPDEELFAIAAKGELHKPEVLEQQTRRMLKDPKSRALVDNFASQWLNLRNLDIATPNQKTFDGFNDELRADMRRETEMLFETVMREDLSIVRFLDADFTFVNERLAKHYGIPDIKGGEFQRVSLTGGKRTGVLSHASILTLTSDPTKTSPVKRGKWVLENLLGAGPPPPPAKVPDLAETKKAKPDATLREQMELHRSNAMCASCHKSMDPMGLSLENFDGVGRWREKDGDKPIDASGTLPSGEKIANAQDLIRVLKGREAEFTRHYVRTLLTYALGRGLEYYDKCAVDSITSAARADAGRFSRVVIEIVRSEPFLMRRGDGGQE
ncbi:MAG: DUF1592 domain-containing protein [Planctomycetaceae bacterium]